MNLETLKFPVILIWPDKNCISVDRSCDDLTICTKLALRNGVFDNLIIVDSTGCAVRIKGAQKIQGVGPFWGYNIFLNQTIKIKFIVEGEPFHMSAEEMKTYILECFQKDSDFWEEVMDFDELKESVKKAETIPEIFKSLIDLGGC